MALARISIQPKAKVGEAVPVRLVIQHAMETGFRVEPDGSVVKKNLIKWITCKYAGRDVWRAETGSGISANPYFEFFIRADKSGDIEVNWEDDASEKGAVSAKLEVA
ncbi:MAG: thiosulfate oxidation carrier complex protein SoxZ [Betaproteobacteria bacterium]